MSVIKMFVQAVASTAPQVASIDIPEDGVLESVALGIAANNPTPVGGDVSTAELSFMSTPQFTSNDVRGSLAQCASIVSGVGAATNLMQAPSVPFAILNHISVPVSAGERLFLHLQNTFPDGNSNAVAYLYINDKLGAGRPATRRR